MSQNIKSLLNQLAEFLPDAAKIDTSVSNGSIGWHIEHLALSTRNIILALKAPKESPIQKSFNIKRIWVLGIGKIPRGKGKAPAPSVPKPETQQDIEHLSKSIQKAKLAVQNLENLPKDAYFPHPIFGHLDCKQSERFIEVHLRHHIRIIEEIKSLR